MCVCDCSSSNGDTECAFDSTSVALQQILPRCLRNPTASTCVCIPCERVPPHFPKFGKEHQWEPRYNQPQKRECPACGSRLDVGREEAEIVRLDDDEVQKRGRYVDPDGAASNLGLKLSDVQTVFSEIGGHGEI